MANIEDEADFGSNFLDSMLEVQMTEDDNELDVSKNDPGNDLPPVPTFDLQSETMFYKDSLNSIAQPVLTAIPMSQGPPATVPLVIQPSPVIIYPRDKVQTAASTPRLQTSSKTATRASNSANKKKNSEKFLQRVFKPEFVKYVFVKVESSRELSEVGEDEMAYYLSCFEDVSKVQMCRLHCTICDKHLGCGVSVEKKINVHKMLLVLTCKPCFEFYGDGNFPCDKGDNCEIYCRWCGQGGALVCCSYCPRVFCKKCVKRNFGMPFLKSIEKALDWACFCCAQKPLWPHRAICRALVAYIEQKKTDPKALQKDSTFCCKARKKMKALENNKTLLVQSSLKLNPAAKALDLKDKIQLFPRVAKESLLKSSLQTKAVGTFTPKFTPKGSGVFSTRSLLTGNNVISGLTSEAPSGLFSPYLTSAPVLHGETVITPPSRFLVQARSNATSPTRPIIQTRLASPSNSQGLVKVALSNQSTTMDLSKIPTAKIPHDVQGRILRLCFPDNRVQLIRLVMEGCCSSNTFPMPEFKEKKPAFIDQNLAAAFKVSKMTYEKLMRIRERVKTRTKFTEENVYAAAVKKLHGTYQKSIELLKELDKTLTESWDEWRSNSKTPVDVIELSDEETTSARQNKSNRYASFREKCKELKVSDDSDIEILDDVSDAVNGQTNHKGRSLLRISRAQVRLEDGPVVVRKRRKKGRGRKPVKRFKLSLGNGEKNEDPLKLNETERAEDVDANQKTPEPTSTRQHEIGAKKEDS